MSRAADALPKVPQCVAVLRFSSAGDVLLTAPALQALKQAWPHCRVLFVTHPPFASLVAQQPHIDAVLALPPQAAGHSRQLGEALRAAGVQAVVDLHGKWRSRILRCWLPRCRWVTWQKRALQRSLAHAWGGARAYATQQTTQRYHAAIEALVGKPLPQQPLRYFVTASAQQQAQNLLQQHGITSARPLVGFSPGALWATKRWPVARFAAVAQVLQQRGIQVLLTGSAAEKPLQAQLQADAPHAIGLAGCGDLATLAAIVQRCQVFVANDSGPMHLARALGVPTVAIFGCTDPRQFDFRGHRLLYQPPPCAPCTFHGRAYCPRGHLQCLTAITPATVLQQIELLLGAGRGTAIESI